MSKTALSSVQAGVLNSDNINLAILERLQALEKQLIEARKPAARRAPAKKAAAAAAAGAAGAADDAATASAAEAKPSKKQLQSINTTQFCIFDSSDIAEYVDEKATADVVWLSYIPDTVIPAPAESSADASFRTTHCPIIEMNREKFIQMIEKLGKKNRIFTISGKDYHIVTKYHCDSTASGDGDKWTINPCEDEESNIH
jgi:hypothetical protein